MIECLQNIFDVAGAISVVGLIAVPFSIVIGYLSARDLQKKTIVEAEK